MTESFKLPLFAMESFSGMNLYDANHRFIAFVKGQSCEDAQEIARYLVRLCNKSEQDND